MIIVSAWLRTQIKSRESVILKKKPLAKVDWKKKTKHTYLGLCLFEIEWDEWKKKKL